MPRVSALLSVYNAGQFVPCAIDSILGQTFEDFELLILDDGSDDQDTIDAIDATDDPRVRKFRFNPTEEERAQAVRYSRLFNIAIENYAAGDYLAYCCGDDYWMRDRLERMLATMDERGCDVVYGAQMLLDESGWQFGIRETLGVLDDAFHRVDLNSVLHTRASFDACGGWDEDPARWRDADGWTWRRLHQAGFRFFPVDGGPTDAKRFRDEGVDARVIAGLDPWR